ncbi:hypothetical protein [Falsibacillus albus]|uniref:Uncharacterized protein n=1 Tax=Falsibacillus albus TaxID=2478915 RepID=A0A3L7JNA4_9BACI|nr:hypothetical protein [Falsibacillus albus]RLQ92298.1 hypothetical protein D9X91_19675 [Falsibacillus albus]
MKKLLRWNTLRFLLTKLYHSKLILILSIYLLLRSSINIIGGVIHQNVIESDIASLLLGMLVLFIYVKARRNNAFQK